MSELHLVGMCGHSQGTPVVCKACMDAERDRLHSHIQNLQVTNGSLTDIVDKLKSEHTIHVNRITELSEENDRLRADVEEAGKNMDHWIHEANSVSLDRDRWKSRAERLEGALKKIHNAEYTCAQSVLAYEMTLTAKAALEQGEDKP